MFAVAVLFAILVISNDSLCNQAAATLVVNFASVNFSILAAPWLLINIESESDSEVMMVNKNTFAEIIHPNKGFLVKLFSCS